MVASMLKLNPMGVTVLKLYPMSVTAPKLIPMGVTVLKLIPMGVTVHRLFSVFFMRTKKRKKKSRRFVRIAGITEIVGGIVIFLLQLCLLLSAFKNCP
jgi:hypothetical protein